EAVGGRVATADDDDVPAGGVDRCAVGFAGHQAVGRDEVVHGEVDAGQLAARRRRHVPPGQRATGEEHGVVAFPELRDGQVDPDGAAGHELHTFGGELREPPVDMALLDLEVRDAVPQQPAEGVVALV